MKNVQRCIVAISLFAVLSVLAAASAQAKPVTIKSAPYVINTPGHYVLGTNITLTEASNGITISANNVTLDMNGYGITGFNSSAYGISISGQGIEVKNGYLTGFYYGVAETSSTNHDNKYVNLRVYSNDNDGIHLAGNGAIVRDCQVTSNEGYGITVFGIGCIVEGNAIRNSTNTGVFCSSAEGTVIINNTICNNGGWGIHAGIGGAVIGNTVNTNSGGGINAPSCALVNNNTCMGNSGGGNIVYGGGCTTTGYVNNTQ